MKKELIKYLLEIFFATIFIIISYIYWNYNDFSTEIETAKYFTSNYTNKYETNNLTYNFESNLEYDNLIPVFNDNYDKSDARYFMIQNNSLNPIAYKMDFKIYKKSNINIDSVVILLNNEIIKLCDIDYIEKDNQYIIQTDDYIINDKDIYRLVVYLDKDKVENFSNYSLSMDMEVIEL